MSVLPRTSLRMTLLPLAVIGLIATQVWSAAPARAAIQPVYDGVPTVLAPNYPSLGYQATSTAEFGDLVELVGTARDLQAITVGFSSWACETGGWNTTCTTTPGATFAHPITVNVYQEGIAPLAGALLATVTQTIDVPYRPSSDPVNCTRDTRQWLDSATGSCVNGVAFTETFDFAALDVTLPGRVVVAIAYNTQTYGATPLGVGGPYDSLNVALAESPPTAGSDVDPDAVHWNTTHAANYTDGGTDGVGVLRVDTGWSPYSLMIDIAADDGVQLPTLPTSGDAGSTPAELPTLAATGSEPSPVAAMVALVAIILGTALVSATRRSSSAHRAEKSRRVGRAVHG